MMSNYEIAVTYINLVIPTCSQNYLAFVTYLTNLYFVRLMDNAAMTAGYGLSTTMCHLLGLSLFIGANSAQETLTSQAFGAGELFRCGTLLNRGRMILVVLFIPITLIFLFSERIFLLIG
jgi:MATE family multidrug resistance protein